MKPVIFHSDAAQEARDARSYYEALRVGLGGDFQTEVNAAMARIQKNPKLYEVVRRRVPGCRLHRFPYSLYYEEMDDQIWIAAVGHHSRRRKYWSGRRPSEEG